MTIKFFKISQGPDSVYFHESTPECGQICCFFISEFIPGFSLQAKVYQISVCTHPVLGGEVHNHLLKEKSP